MNINVSKDLNSVFPVKNVNENVSDIEKQSAAPKTIESDKGERDSAKEAVYGDVIGVSANGDVASAKKESMQALDDGMVFKKEETASLTNYTENQLQQMYEQGKINKFKYDREIERRAEIRDEEPKENPVVEQMKEEAENKENPVVTQMKEASKEEKDNKDEKEVNSGIRETDNSEKEDEKKSIVNSDDEDKEAVKTNQATDTKIAEDMAKLVADQQDQQIKANAVKDAIANDRADLIADVFGKNN